MNCINKENQMTNSPLVSICMFTHNHESYIEESIKSIIYQTYTNWELIILDNASTDNTKEVIESTIKCYPNINFLPQTKSILVSNSIQIFTEMAKGKYIIFFSANDVLHTRQFENKFNLIERRFINNNMIEDTYSTFNSCQTFFQTRDNLTSIMTKFMNNQEDSIKLLEGDVMKLQVLLDKIDEQVFEMEDEIILLHRKLLYKGTFPWFINKLIMKIKSKFKSLL